MAFMERIEEQCYADANPSHRSKSWQNPRAR